MSTSEQDRRWGTSYCIQLEGEKSLPLGCTITFAPWENESPPCQLSLLVNALKPLEYF